MSVHTCPICSLEHEVRPARAALAYGRQLTCSPDCESERRRRMRVRPAHEQVDVEPRRSAWTPRSPEVARVLHTWVTVRAAADLIRAHAAQRRVARRR